MLFEFGFDHVEIGNKTKEDKKIRTTILHILLSFFDFLPNAAIFYVCDSTDDAHSASKNLFDRWLYEYQKTGNSLFVKYDFEPELEEMELIISFISLKNNPQLNLMLESFEQVIQEYSDKMQ